MRPGRCAHARQAASSAAAERDRQQQRADDARVHERAQLDAVDVGGELAARGRAPGSPGRSCRRRRPASGCSRDDVERDAVVVVARAAEARERARAPGRRSAPRLNASHRSSTLSTGLPVAATTATAPSSASATAPTADRALRAPGDGRARRPPALEQPPSAATTSATTTATRSTGVARLARSPIGAAASRRSAETSMTCGAVSAAPMPTGTSASERPHPPRQRDEQHDEADPGGRQRPRGSRSAARRRAGPPRRLRSARAGRAARRGARTARARARPPSARGRPRRSRSRPARPARVPGRRRPGPTASGQRDEHPRPRAPTIATVHAPDDEQRARRVEPAQRRDREHRRGTAACGSAPSQATPLASAQVMLAERPRGEQRERDERDLHAAGQLAEARAAGRRRGRRARARGRSRPGTRSSRRSRRAIAPTRARPRRPPTPASPRRRAGATAPSTSPVSWPRLQVMAARTGDDGASRHGRSSTHHAAGGARSPPRAGPRRADHRAPEHRRPGDPGDHAQPPAGRARLRDAARARPRERRRGLDGRPRARARRAHDARRQPAPRPRRRRPADGRRARAAAAPRPPAARAHARRQGRDARPRRDAARVSAPRARGRCSCTRSTATR